MVRLKDASAISTLLSGDVFQFLDGAIKRSALGTAKWIDLSFQFLDGAIKSYINFFLLFARINVSIP